MERKKGKSYRIKRRNNYILLVIILILVVFSIWLWISRPLKVETLDVRFIVDKNIGIDLNSSELNFGKLTRGGSSVRNVIAENTYEYPIKVKIFVSRNIADYVFSDSEIVILPGEKTKIPISLKLPKDISFGNYSGEIRFEFRKI